MALDIHTGRRLELEAERAKHLAELTAAQTSLAKTESEMSLLSPQSSAAAPATAAGQPWGLIAVIALAALIVGAFLGSPFARYAEGKVPRDHQGKPTMGSLVSPDFYPAHYDVDSSAAARRRAARERHDRERFADLPDYYPDMRGR